MLALGGACGHTKTSAQKALDALSKGLAAHRAGNLTEAAKDYHEVLALDPNNKFAYFDLGVIDQAQGRSQAAEANYRQALQIDPNFTSALFNLAIVRKPVDAQEAITLYRRLLVVNPNDAAGHLNLGFALLETGQTAEGNAELARAVQLDPSLQSRVTPPQPTAAATATATGRTKP